MPVKFDRIVSDILSQTWSDLNKNNQNPNNKTSRSTLRTWYLRYSFWESSSLPVKILLSCWQDQNKIVLEVRIGSYQKLDWNLRPNIFKFNQDNDGILSRSCIHVGQNTAEFYTILSDQGPIGSCKNSFGINGKSILDKIPYKILHISWWILSVRKC